jgi:hypothetical protein
VADGATAGLEEFVPAVLLAEPEPKYPATLLSAGLDGVVLQQIRFVAAH